MEGWRGGKRVGIEGVGVGGKGGVEGMGMEDMHVRTKVPRGGRKGNEKWEWLQRDTLSFMMHERSSAVGEPMMFRIRPN